MNEDEHLDRAIETVLADRSPRGLVDTLSDDQRSMLRVAQRLRGSRGQEVAPEFIERLHARLFPTQPRITRRRAVLSALGTLAAGVVAGVGLERATAPGVSWNAPALVGANGRWIPVARLADVPDGSVRPFTAGAVHGFLVREQGQLRALSRVCTHMGCMLNVDQEERAFECPCHGAEFDFQGRLRYGPKKYGQALSPLPPLQTRVRGDTVEVFSV